MIQKEFLTLPIDEVIPYGNNPRINDSAVNDVIASIRQCENIDPIEVDENNIILSGHTRLKALKALEYPEVQVLRITGLTLRGMTLALIWIYLHPILKTKMMTATTVTNEKRHIIP